MFGSKEEEWWFFFVLLGGFLVVFFVLVWFGLFFFCNSENLGQKQLWKGTARKAKQDNTTAITEVITESKRELLGFSQIGSLGKILGQG